MEPQCQQHRPTMRAARQRLLPSPSTTSLAGRKRPVAKTVAEEQNRRSGPELLPGWDRLSAMWGGRLTPGATRLPSLHGWPHSRTTPLYAQHRPEEGKTGGHPLIDRPNEVEARFGKSAPPGRGGMNGCGIGYFSFDRMYSRERWIGLAVNGARKRCGQCNGRGRWKKFCFKKLVMTKLNGMSCRW